MVWAGKVTVAGEWCYSSARMAWLAAARRELAALASASVESWTCLTRSTGVPDIMGVGLTELVDDDVDPLGDGVVAG